MRDRARRLRGREGRRRARVLRGQAGRADARELTAFVCLIEARLHFGSSHDLKQKRKLVKSLKEQLRKRFGAAVAETEGHDKWQRATLLIALVGDSEVGARADEVQRFIQSRFPDDCVFERDLLSLEDIRG